VKRKRKSEKTCGSRLKKKQLNKQRKNGRIKKTKQVIQRQPLTTSRGQPDAQLVPEQNIGNLPKPPGLHFCG